MFAHVIIDNPSSQTDMEFDYLIPDNMSVKNGVRVKVPFGSGNKPTLGIVLDVTSETSYDGNIKEIIEVLDLDPILSAEDIELAKYIKSETICPISRILNLMIPLAKRLKTIKYFQIINGDNLDANLLEEFKGESIVKITPRFDKYTDTIKQSIKNGDLKVITDAVEKKVNKWTKKYLVNITNYNQYYDEFKSAKAKEALNALIRINEELTLDELMDLCNISTYLIEKFKKYGIIEERYELTSRIKNRVLSTKNKEIEDIVYVNKYLTKYQENKKFLYLANNKKEELVFLKKVIEENLRNNLNTLIIVPDILRGYEVYTRVKSLLNCTICNLNSSIDNNEICDYFDLIKDNEYQVVVTTPAYALWCYQNLGCILLMDQESKNYRNDQSPRYDLNLVMNKKSDLLNTKIIYHSYAPLLSTYTKAMLGELTLLSTKAIVNNQITIVDMMESLRRLESNVISNTLRDKMNETFKKHDAALLILNNKGYSKSVSCRACGTTYSCPSCKIPLQLNKEKHVMYCPACFYKEDEITNCKKCFSDKLSYNGFGMEKLEAVVKEMFPNQKIKVLKESSYLELEEIIDDLNENNLDIIITSDTFSKSIESERLKLVGIIDLDVILNNPSFDANHLAYAMLANTNQILSNGELVIQTYNPKHSILKHFIINSYDDYYFEELNNRKALKVEPLYEVNRILVKGDYNQVFKIANNIKKTINNILKQDVIIIGPSYNYKEKMVQLIVKHKNPNINRIYMHIYELYQKTTTLIIFDRYSKVIS